MVQRFWLAKGPGGSSDPAASELTTPREAFIAVPAAFGYRGGYMGPGAGPAASVDAGRRYVLAVKI